VNIRHIKKLEDCLDGSISFCYTLDEQVNEGVMREMAEGGKLQYFPDFPRPFYKLFTGDGVQVKGIIGENHFDVLFPRKNIEERQKTFSLTLQNIHEKIGQTK